MPDCNKQKSSQMWDAFVKGDDNAFAALYFLHINSLLAYGRKITRDAELLHDCIQEIFLDIYEKREKDPVTINNPGGYLMVALRNNLYKKIERSRKPNLHELTPIQVEEFIVEYSFQDTLIIREFNQELVDKIRIAIKNLSHGQKEVIYLKFEENLPYADIARIMKITVESARKQVHRAVISLRKILEPKNLPTFFIFFLKKN